MAIDYSMFDQSVDLDGIRSDVEKAKNGVSGEPIVIPHGVYVVEVTDMELTQTGAKSKNPGSPMVKIEFEITEGEHENWKIWMNQVITQGFQIHIVNEVLEGLLGGQDVQFVSYAQYGKLIEDIFSQIDGRMSYDLKYDKNKAGYNTYEILKSYKLD